jgi:hypothetical protein
MATIKFERISWRKCRPLTPRIDGRFAPNAVIRSLTNGAGRQQVETFQIELVQPLRLFNLIDKERASQYFPAVKHAAGVSDRLPSGDRAAIAR